MFFTEAENVIVTSATFDGAASNVAMFTNFGASLDVNNIKAYLIQAVTDTEKLNVHFMTEMIKRSIGCF